MTITVAGTKTNEKPQDNLDVFKASIGNKVSEKPLTFKMGDDWINASSTQNGKKYSEEEIRQGILEKKFTATSSHTTLVDALNAAKSRTDNIEIAPVDDDDSKMFNNIEKMRDGKIPEKVISQVLNIPNQDLVHNDNNSDAIIPIQQNGKTPFVNVDGEVVSVDFDKEPIRNGAFENPRYEAINIFGEEVIVDIHEGKMRWEERETFSMAITGLKNQSIFMRKAIIDRMFDDPELKKELVNLFNTNSTEEDFKKVLSNYDTNTSKPAIWYTSDEAITDQLSSSDGMGDLESTYGAIAHKMSVLGVMESFVNIDKESPDAIYKLKEFFSAKDRYAELNTSEQLLVDGLMMAEDLLIALPVGTITAMACRQGLAAVKDAPRRIKPVLGAAIVGGCGGMGGFAAIEFNRTLFTELLKRGVVTDITGLQALALAIKDGAKGGITGFLAGMTGGSIRQFFKSRGLKYGSLAAIFPEAAVMTETSHLLHRNQGDSYIADGENFFKNAVLLSVFNVGMHGVERTGQKISKYRKYTTSKINNNLLKIYSKWGLTPDQVVSDLGNHPQILSKLKEQLRSEQFIVPEMYVDAIAEMMARMNGLRSKTGTDGTTVTTTYIVPNKKLLQAQEPTILEVGVKTKDGEPVNAKFEIIGEGEIRIVEVTGELNPAVITKLAETIVSSGRKPISDIKAHDVILEQVKKTDKQDQLAIKTEVEQQFTGFYKEIALIEKALLEQGVEMPEALTKNIEKLSEKDINELLEAFVGKELAAEIKADIFATAETTGAYEIPLNIHGVQNYTGYAISSPVEASSANPMLVSSAQSVKGSSAVEVNARSFNPLILPKINKLNGKDVTIRDIYKDPELLLAYLEKQGQITREDIQQLYADKDVITLEHIYDFLGDGIEIADGTIPGKGYDALYFKDDGSLGVPTDSLVIFKSDTSPITRRGTVNLEGAFESTETFSHTQQSLPLSEFGPLNNVSGHTAYQIYSAISGEKSIKIMDILKQGVRGTFQPKIKIVETVLEDGTVKRERIADEGKITIDLDTFLNNAEAVRVIMHESGHWAQLIKDMDQRKLRRAPILQMLRDVYEEGKSWKEQEHNEVVTKELQDLSLLWKPFDIDADPNYTSYRFSNVELFADFFSAFINNPAAVKKNAPNAYYTFLKSVEGRKFDKAYDKFIAQSRSKLTNTLSIVETTMEGYKKANQYEIDAYKEVSLKDKLKKTTNELRSLYVDRHTPIYQLIDRLGKRTPLGMATREAIERELYTVGYAKHYVTKLHRLLDKLNEAGIDTEILSVYLEKSRDFHDRGGLAKSQMLDIPELANVLAELNAKHPMLNDIRRQIHELRQEWVLPEIESMYDKEFYSLMKDNEFYVKFTPIQVKKYFAFNEFAETMMAADPIKKRIGHVERRADPIAETLKQDLKLIAIGAHNNTVKRVIQVLREVQKLEPETVLFEVAKKKQDGTFKPPQNKALELIKWMDNGKKLGMYVDKATARALNIQGRDTTPVINTLLKFNKYFRNMYTVYNPGFWTFSMFRDFQSAIQNTPAKGSAKYIPYLQHIQYFPFWAKGGKKGYDLAFDKDMPHVDEYIKQKLLVDQKNIVEKNEVMDLNQVDKIVEEYGRERKHIHKVAQFLDRFAAWGQMFAVQNKVAVRDYLHKFHPKMSEAEVNHIVRTRAGDPAYLRKGLNSSQAGAYFLFFNAIKEAYRGEYEAFSEDKMQFSYKVAQTTLVPMIIQLAMLKGYIGTKEQQEVMLGMSRWDLMYYHVFPLGLDENGNGKYIRIPMSPLQAQIKGVLMRQYFDKETTLESFFESSGEALPTIAPIIEIFRLHASASAPLDPITRRPIMSQALWDDKESDERRTKINNYYWGLSGGGTFVNAEALMADTDNKQQTGLEKFLDTPVLGTNFFARYIRSTSSGHSSIIQERLDTAKKLKQHQSNLRRAAALKVVQDPSYKFTAEENEAINSSKKSHTSFIKYQNKFKAQEYGVWGESYESASKEEKPTVVDAAMSSANRGNKGAQKFLRKLNIKWK